MSNFVYYNANPQKIEEGDCVCRAISLASGYEYEEIMWKLFLTAKLYECDELCVCCYRHLLSDVFKYPKVRCMGMTVNEFARLHPKGVYVLRMDGHASCLLDGRVWDIWDCGDEILTDVWRAE